MALARVTMMGRRAAIAATAVPRVRLAHTARAHPRSIFGAAGAATVLAGTVAIFGLTTAEEANCGMFGVDEAVVNKIEERLRKVEVSLAGQTNSAFVFIKPHACKGHPGAVEKLVKDKFAAAGIRVTGEGDMSAETIDKNLYIDTHYGAIASKAVKLQPSELNVPDKGKKKFKELFGLSWDDAIAQGLVYNAKDGAAKLGVDGAGLNDKWSTLVRGKTSIKFGGGFYCGKVDGIFIMNGFYMSMRDAYCAPGEKIHWFTVSWPTAQLSWEDFRGKVLGATNPSEAGDGSVRKSILQQYKELGLKSQPNTGDNGVHASASPFEALAERSNWLGVAIPDDEFGRGMIAAGVPEETIKAWSTDPQVSVAGEAKKMSLFDALEDMDADSILAFVKDIN